MSLFKLIGFVKRGKNRNKIFVELNYPSMPSELTKKIFGKSSNTYFNIVSRSLSELKKEGLVEIVNPDEKTGRIYRRTALGNKVALAIKKN